jgi:hypothetical protein
MESIIKIEAFNEDGYIETIEMELYEFYDGDLFEEIIKPDNLISKGIISLKGTQYWKNGNPEIVWQTYYDNLGKLIKSESNYYDDKGNWIKSGK